MIHHSSRENVAREADAGRQIAQLRHVLTLIEEIAGQPVTSADALDEMARIGSAYAVAPPVAQRRFDALAAETADWAAAGVKALITARGPSQRPRAAARQLAEELGRSLRKLGRLVV